MKHQETLGRRNRRSRLAPAALILFATFAALIPASAARQTAGRPRRATTSLQKATPTPTPQKIAPQTTATPKQTPVAPRRTPTPGPTVTPQQDEEAPPAPPKFQISPSAQPDAPTQDQSGQEVDPEEVVRVDTSLVNLHVRVVDRNNRPVGDVKKEEFRVFENGVQQQVEFITQEEVPITYGLVVDNSGSLRNQINQVIEAGKTIVESNKPGDETFVVRFISSEDIKIMQDFTADKSALGDALEDMFVEGGQTAIIDAVYLSAQHAGERRKGNPLEDKRRRAVIVVTDGEDRASFYKQEQLFESLKEEDVQIYIIGFVNELDKERGFISKSKRQKAVDLLDKMAKETGGRAFYPTSLSELPKIAEEITKDLRTQYVISYVPTAKARPGEFRPVRVAVADTPNREKRIAITRSGYTAKGENAQPPSNQSPPTVRRQ
ncbi:MAG TPA: VWA domain-containing protein [Pyrinomonadaceae bacterium]|nr:VWA domain-containing protein [Pyrinomonadaceae bacterium]